VSVDIGAAQRFRVIRPIGEGGMGVVYEAEDCQRGQLVALKTLKHRDLDTLYRLKREFRALAHLSHPNLVDLYDMVVEADTGFLTMELVEGTDIIRYCRPADPVARWSVSPSRADTETPARMVPVRDPVGHPLPAMPRTVRATPASASFDEMRLRSVLPQLARALCALHQAGMVHRDIKPPNVLVTHSGRVVVLDFGLVAELDDRSGDSMTGRIVGTVEYIAPEQVSDGRVSPAADWYGFGCLLYEALTGRVPHHGPVMQVLLDKQSHPPPPPRALVSGIPPDLDALCVDLLAIDPWRRPGGAEVMRRLGADDMEGERRGSVSGHTHHAAFAGRELELARLTECARQVGDGGAAVVAVSGPSGIGKTALVRRFIEALRRDSGDQLVVLEGRCYERETVPYKAIDAVIDQLTRYWGQLSSEDAAELLPGNAPLLPRLFPGLGRVPAIAAAPRGPVPTDPHELRYDAFSALRHVFKRLAVKRELVLFLDDLQWGDLDSIRLLADIMRPPDPPALLLIFCSRDQQDHGSWDELSVEAPIRHAALDSLLSALSPRLTRIELGPLAQPDAIELARQFLRGATPRLAERVAEEAGGLPLFIAELAIHMQTVASQDSRPIGLDELLRRRVDQLPDNARELLELVSVAGEPISQRVAASALSCSPEALGRAIRYLRTVHLVQAPGGRATDRVECYHSRIRECVVARLGKHRETMYHQALAVALEQWSEGTSEQLARHWGGAGEPLKASEYARNAAEEAERKIDFNRAARFYRLALGPHVIGDERRALLCSLAGALGHAGRPAEAARAYREAADLADSLSALELRHQSAASLLRGGYIGQGLEEIESVLRELGMQVTPAPRMSPWRRLWLTYRTTHCRTGEADLTRRVLTEMDVLGSMAIALSTLDTARGAEFQAHHFRLALRHGEPRRVAVALALEAGYLAGAGKYRAAERMAARADRLVEETGDQAAVPYLMWARGALAMFRDSQWRAGLDAFRRGMSVVREQHRVTAWETSTGELYAFACRLWLGELPVLVERVPGFIRAAELRGDNYSALTARVRLAPLVHLWRGDGAAALRELDGAIAAWAGAQRGSAVRNPAAIATRADILLQRGEPDRMSRHVRIDVRGLAASQFARYPFVLRETAHALARVALARAAGTRGDERAGALAEVGDAMALLRRDQAPVWHAFAALLDAGCARIAGLDEEARRFLETAIAGLDSLHMVVHAAAARRALGRLIGGSEGEALTGRADEHLELQGIAEPAAWAAVVAPGL
jgi:eukaryotic-like serine/threonine-protein kinase